jgi:hypothetical protein
VKSSFVVGRDVGGDFEWGAVFVPEDLDGYRDYLMAPSHARTDEIGLPLLERFVSYDTTDDPDPAIGEKIADLHRRRFAERPELTRMVRLCRSTSAAAHPTRADRRDP